MAGFLSKPLQFSTSGRRLQRGKEKPFLFVVPDNELYIAVAQVTFTVKENNWPVCNAWYQYLED